MHVCIALAPSQLNTFVAIVFAAAGAFLFATSSCEKPHSTPR